jgi:death-on-curing protein
LPSEIEPRWLPIEVVINLNQQEVAETGEPFFVRDRGALEAALMKPRNLWHYEGEDNTVALASSLLFGIARNHPFEQGNKRTALGAAYLFLRINGYQLVLPDTELLGEIIVQVLTGEAPEGKFIDVVTAYGVIPL